MPWPWWDKILGAPQRGQKIIVNQSKPILVIVSIKPLTRQSFRQNYFSREIEWAQFYWHSLLSLVFYDNRNHKISKSKKSEQYVRDEIEIFIRVFDEHFAHHFESHWRETWRHTSRRTVPQIFLETPPPTPPPIPPMPVFLFLFCFLFFFYHLPIKLYRGAL